MSRTGRSVQLPSSHNTNLFIEAEFVGSIVIYSYTGSIVKGREDVLLCLVFLDSTYVVTCTKIVTTRCPRLAEEGDFCESA